MILVDDREPDAIKSALSHACTTANIPLSVHREQFGDFHLYPPTGTQKVVCVERKAVSDFVSSLTSGRLQTQLDGLRSICDIPYLVIEGDLKSTLVGGKHMLLLGGRASKFNIFSLQMYLASIQDSGVRWAHTASTTHTVLWVVKNYQRLCKGEGVGVTTFAHNSKAALPPAVAALTAAPGVGPKVAQALIDKFGTVAAIVSATDSELSTIEKVGAATIKSLRLTLGRASS